MPEELAKPFLEQGNRTRVEAFRLAILSALAIKAFFVAKGR